MIKTILVCDVCGIEQPEDAAINWHRIEVAGIDARTVDDAGLPGLYCSHGCVLARLSPGVIERRPRPEPQR